MNNADFADWLAICNVKARYCRCLDTKDWIGYAACFTDDVVIDTTGSGGPRMVGKASAVANVHASIDAAETVHQVHAPEIVIDGVEATGVWAMHDQVTWPGGRRLIGYGHYHERYSKVAGEWRIAESRLTRLSMEMTEGH